MSYPLIDDVLACAVLAPGQTHPLTSDAKQVIRIVGLIEPAHAYRVTDEGLQRLPEGVLRRGRKATPGRYEWMEAMEVGQVRRFQAPSTLGISSREERKADGKRFVLSLKPIQRQVAYYSSRTGRRFSWGPYGEAGNGGLECKRIK